MGKAISLGLVLGAKLAPGFGAVFRTAKEQAQGLKTTLSQAKLGATVSSDMARLGARLERMRASMPRLGTDNVKLNARIAQTQKDLNKASDAAKRYGITLDNASSMHRRFATTADQATAALSRLRSAEQRKAVRDEAKGQIVGTVASVVSVAAPVKESMDFQHRLRGIGNIADMSRKEVASLGQAVLNTGVDVNQTSDAMLDAYNVLLGKGLESSRASAVLSPIGKTATAAQASVEDLSTTTFSLLDNLKLQESEIPKAMDMLAQAGKEGSFELKDMARYFPQLTAQAATLGLKGKEGVATLGASLQIAMKGAGSPEEAATNLRNFLQKATAPDTIKNFAKMGVNLEASLKKATAKGKNPLEYLLDLIQKVTKGDKFKVGALFGDMQVQNFLAPMMQHMEEYREIKQKSLEAEGVVDRDFVNMMETAKERVKHLGVEFKRVGINLGELLLPAVGLVADKLGALLSAVNTLALAHPKLATAVLAATVALVGFKVALLAAKFGGTLLFGGMQSLVGVFGFFRLAVLRANGALLATQSASLGAAAAGGVLRGVMQIGRGVLLGLAGTIRLLTRSQWLWNVAMNANPLGLLVVGAVALGAAAFLIYRNWGPIKSFFQGLWEGMSEGLQPLTSMIERLGQVLQPVLEKAEKLWDVVSNFLSSSKQEASEEAESWGKRIGKMVPNVIGAALPYPLSGLAAWMLASDEKTPARKIEPTQEKETPKGGFWGRPVDQVMSGAPDIPASGQGWRQDFAPKKPAAGSSFWGRFVSQVANKQPAVALGQTLPAAVSPGVVPPSGKAGSVRPEMESEMARLVEVTRKSLADISAPEKSTGKAGSQAGVTVNNSFTLQGVGLETVMQAIKNELDKFARNLDSKLAAMRADQLRVSYGG